DHAGSDAVAATSAHGQQPAPHRGADVVAGVAPDDDRAVGHPAPAARLRRTGAPAGGAGPPGHAAPPARPGPAPGPPLHAGAGAPRGRTPPRRPSQVRPPAALRAISPAAQRPTEVREPERLGPQVAAAVRGMPRCVEQRAEWNASIAVEDLPSFDFPNARVPEP